MSKLIILTVGYVIRMEGDSLLASPTTTLVENNGLKLLIDPGANQKQLMKALSREGLHPSDIDVIFLTHYHLDHLLNIRLFPNKDICDVKTIYHQDLETSHAGLVPGTDVEVIPTPGHSPEHASLVVNAEQGRCLIAGDLFWWFNDQEQKKDLRSLMDLKDDFATDLEDLKESRRRSLKKADYIIPGHGKPFAVEK